MCLFCRFLPKNNNLVVCGVNSGAVRLFNVSTGKFVAHVSSPVLGKSLCAEVREEHGNSVAYKSLGVILRAILMAIFEAGLYRVRHRISDLG